MRDRPRSNDLLRLVPRTEFPDARVLDFDFPGLEIGVAEYEEGPDGLHRLPLPEGRVALD